MKKVRIISLLQPWASLVVMVKVIETRSWSTAWRGPMLIHASRSNQMAKLLAHTDPFNKYIKHFSDLPYGQILGAINLKDVAPLQQFESMLTTPDKIKKYGFGQHEKDFGDYNPGRWGWWMQDVRKFKYPIPHKGNQGLMWYPKRICLQCGCVEEDCRVCVEKTGFPCHWITDTLCSACKDVVHFEG